MLILLEFRIWICRFLFCVTVKWLVNMCFVYVTFLLRLFNRWLVVFSIKVWDREKVVIIPDHYIFTSDQRANRNVDILRDFCAEQKIKYFYDITDLGNFKVIESSVLLIAFVFWLKLILNAQFNRQIQTIKVYVMLLLLKKVIADLERYKVLRSFDIIP